MCIWFRITVTHTVRGLFKKRGGDFLWVCSLPLTPVHCPPDSCRTPESQRAHAKLNEMCLLLPDVLSVAAKVADLSSTITSLAPPKTQEVYDLALTQRPHGGVRWSLPVGVSETRPTTNDMNLPPRTHKHAVWLARACTGIWFDWLTLPSKLQKLNIAQLLKRATQAKRSDATTMQFGKAWRHPIQSEWAEALKLQRTPPCGRAITV